jgi:hypothetical protein
MSFTMCKTCSAAIWIRLLRCRQSDRSSREWIAFSLAGSPCSARKVFNPYLDADIRNSYPHATRTLSVSPAQEGSTLPEADAPTLGPDPGSTSVSTPPTSGPLPGDPQPFPTSIRRYRILRLLGEGGMGMVYEAEQDFPQRIVALKVIRAGYATGEMLRRFENETQRWADCSIPASRRSTTRALKGAHERAGAKEVAALEAGLKLLPAARLRLGVLHVQPLEAVVELANGLITRYAAVALEALHMRARGLRHC